MDVESFLLREKKSITPLGKVRKGFPCEDDVKVAVARRFWNSLREIKSVICCDGSQTNYLLIIEPVFNHCCIFVGMTFDVRNTLRNVLLVRELSLNSGARHTLYFSRLLYVQRM
jgi:hypothetical protein